MLTDIRNRAASPVGFVILGLIALTFVLVGPTMSFTGQAYYARVNGIDVLPSDIEQTYQQQAAAFRSRFGELVPAVDQRLRAEAQEQVITQKVMESYVTDNRIVAAPDSIRERITDDPSFQADGQFSRDLYRETLAGAGVAPERFERQIGDSIALTQFRDGIAATSFVTPAELRQYIELQRETRTASYAVFPLANWVPAEAPSDERIAGYYDENVERFQTEESAQLSYVELSVDAIANDIVVDDAALETYFADVVENYRTDPERNPRHILITIDDGDEAGAETLAQSLTARARAGEDFAALATEFSKDGGSAARGGDLGWVRPGQFVGSVDEAVFAMDVDEIRGPVRSEFGYHVLRLDGVRDGGLPALSDVRDDVVRDYRRSQAELAFNDKNALLGDAIFDDPTLEELATAVGLDVQTVDNFTRASTALFLNNPDVTEAVFGEVGVRGAALSEPIEFDPGRVAVLRVDEFSPPQAKPLAEVRDEIVATIQRDDAFIARDVALAGLRASAADGEFATLAAELGGELAESTAVRRDQPGGVPGDLAATLFEERAPADGAVTYGRANGAGDDAIVFALEAVEPGDPGSLGVAEREALRRQLAQQTGLGDFAALVLTLRDEASINFGSLARQASDADL